MPFEFWKISQLVLVLSTKNRFSAAILNFYNQTGSKILKSRLLCPIPGRTWSYAVYIILKISLLVFELRGNNIQTDRQTYIHTYRQTDGTKLLYRYHLISFDFIAKTFGSVLFETEIRYFSRLLREKTYYVFGPSKVQNPHPLIIKCLL